MTITLENHAESQYEGLEGDYQLDVESIKTTNRSSRECWVHKDIGNNNSIQFRKNGIFIGNKKYSSDRSIECPSKARNLDIALKDIKNITTGNN